MSHTHNLIKTIYIYIYKNPYNHKLIKPNLKETNIYILKNIQHFPIFKINSEIIPNIYTYF